MRFAELNADLRPPAHSGDVALRADRERRRDRKVGSELCRLVFPYPVQDACGLHENSICIQTADVLGAAHGARSHGPANPAGNFRPSARRYILPWTSERGSRRDAPQSLHYLHDLVSEFLISVKD
jgi:hypothetical protein